MSSNQAASNPTESGSSGAKTNIRSQGDALNDLTFLRGLKACNVELWRKKRGETTHVVRNLPEMSDRTVISHRGGYVSPYCLIAWYRVLGRNLAVDKSACIPVVLRDNKGIDLKSSKEDEAK